MSHIVRWICAAVVLALLLGRGLAPTWPVILSSFLAAGVLALGLA